MRMRRAVLGGVLAYLACSIALAIILAEVAFHPSRGPVINTVNAQTTFAPSGAELQDVSIRAADGVQLNAWHARPSNANGAAIILLHGIGDNRQGMIGFAATYLSRGYAVLVPDSRGHGLSGGIPTYGVKEVGDVTLWYEWLQAQSDCRCVYGMGESMGAAIVLQAAEHVPFCAVVAESPFASFRQIAYIRVGQFFATGTWLGKTVLRRRQYPHPTVGNDSGQQPGQGQSVESPQCRPLRRQPRGRPRIQ